MEHPSDSVQLTQASSGAMDPLTQPLPLALQFGQDSQSVPNDCIVYETNGRRSPICFFGLDIGAFDDGVARGNDADVVVPSVDGKCGVSRLSF